MEIVIMSGLCGGSEIVIMSRVWVVVLVENVIMSGSLLYAVKVEMSQLVVVVLLLLVVVVFARLIHFKFYSVSYQ